MKAMKKDKKRIICLVAAIMLLLTACGKSSEPTSGEQDAVETDIAANVEETFEETTEARKYSDAPVIDLGGSDFVIITQTWGIPIWMQRDITAEEEVGEVFNDAVYKRNLAVEEKYNCKIVEMPVADLNGTLSKYVRAGDSAVDAATPRLRSLSSLSVSGYLVEFDNLKYADITKPWWDKNSAESLSVVGKLFGVCSDLTVMDNDSTSALVFNKQLLADYAIEDPYTLVKNDEWTLDKLQEMTKKVSGDVNGDGVRDNQDSYGLLYQRDSMTSFLTGCGEAIAAKDTNDIPVMTLNTPKALEVLNYLYDFLYDDVYCFHVMKYFDAKGIDFTEGMTKMFQNDQALFMWIRMADVENLRSMDTNFGILPIPKYNKAQETYLHNVNPHVGTVTAVPQSAKSIENSSIILDALACESKYLLHPAYYDICLNGKITRDSESSEMLDIIFSNRIYDIGDIYDFGGLGNEVIYMTMTYDRSIVSKYEKLETKANTAIDKMVTGYSELN